MEGTRWDKEKGSERGRERGRFGAGKRLRWWELNVRRRSDGVDAPSPFVCRGVFARKSLCILPNGGRHPRSPGGAHMAKQPGRSRLFGTKYARCAQLWSLNYLVRVSLFIEYRCLFIPQASLRVAVREKRCPPGEGRRIGRRFLFCEFRHLAERGDRLLFGLTSKPEVVGIPRCANRTADFRVLQKTRVIYNKQVYYQRHLNICTDHIPLHH